MIANDHALGAMIDPTAPRHRRPGLAEVGRVAGMPTGRHMLSGPTAGKERPHGKEEQ